MATSLSAGYVSNGEGFDAPSTGILLSERSEESGANRVYHDNACPLGRDIPQNERKLGDGRHRLCVDCRRLNNLGNLTATSSGK
jgi:hypothetical protein